MPEVKPWVVMWRESGFDSWQEIARYAVRGQAEAYAYALRCNVRGFVETVWSV